MWPQGEGSFLLDHHAREQVEARRKYIGVYCCSSCRGENQLISRWKTRVHHAPSRNNPGRGGGGGREVHWYSFLIYTQIVLSYDIISNHIMSMSCLVMSYSPIIRIHHIMSSFPTHSILVGGRHDSHISGRNTKYQILLVCCALLRLFASGAGFHWPSRLVRSIVAAFHCLCFTRRTFFVSSSFVDRPRHQRSISSSSSSTQNERTVGMET